MAVWRWRKRPFPVSFVQIRIHPVLINYGTHEKTKKQSQEESQKEAF